MASLARRDADDLYLYHEALASRPSLEAVHRIDKLLAGSSPAWSADMVQRLRTVACLERMGTRGARALLKRMAEGEPRARLTREARAALGRWK